MAWTTNGALKIRTDQPIHRAFVATPDYGLGRLRQLPFQSGQDADGAFVALAVPRLEFWNLLLLVPYPPQPEEP